MYRNGSGLVHEATVDRSNDLSTPSRKGIARSMGDLTLDLFSLSELQFQLLASDLRAGSGRILAIGITTLACFTMGAVAVPLAFVALALFFRDMLETSLATSFLLSACVGSLMSVCLGIIGWLMIRRSSTILMRSYQELVCNLRWIKRVLERERNTANQNPMKSPRRL
jgi:hypothetical protein